MKSKVSHQNFTLLVCFTVTLLTTALFSMGTAVAGNPFDGRPLYYKYCFDCHESSGSTYMLNAPDFKKREGLMVTDQQLLAIIKNGKGIMPGYQGILKDEQILDVITYIRNIF